MLPCIPSGLVHTSGLNRRKRNKIKLTVYQNYPVNMFSPNSSRTSSIHFLDMPDLLCDPTWATPTECHLSEACTQCISLSVCAEHFCSSKVQMASGRTLGQSCWSSRVALRDGHVPALEWRLWITGFGHFVYWRHSSCCFCWYRWQCGLSWFIFRYAATTTTIFYASCKCIS